MTESAGKVGTPVILLLTALLSAYGMPTLLDKVKEFLKIFLVMALTLSLFAYLNEHLLKPAIRQTRPSHGFILHESNSKALLDSLYTLDEAERRRFFQDLITSDTIHFKAIDPRILKHWVAEAGYSFPSGHSFNAFLLAGILGFKLQRSHRVGIRKLAILPFIWAGLVALSRVAIGAHTALDISFGAAMGLGMSLILIAFPLTRRLLETNSKTAH